MNRCGCGLYLSLEYRFFGGYVEDMYEFFRVTIEPLDCAVCRRSEGNWAKLHDQYERLGVTVPQP